MIKRAAQAALLSNLECEKEAVSMTIREAIEAVDRLTPNQYENIDKVRWLSELDGVVFL